MPIKIDLTKCQWEQVGKCACSCSCGSLEPNCCAEKCPNGAISREGGVKVDASKCDDCGVCVKACPYGAITLA